MTYQPPSQPPGPRALPWFTIATAFVLVAFFIWLTVEMFLVRIDVTDITWARSMAIYSVIEAFALSAAGALMGVQIQSGRVRAAEQRAEAKDKEAKSAIHEASQLKDELSGHATIVRKVRQRLNLLAGSELSGSDPISAATELEVIRRLVNTLD